MATIVKRNEQRKYGVVFFAVNLSLVAIFLQSGLSEAAISWVLGLSFGFVFQKSRFCTVAAIRDIFLLQNFTLAKNVLLYLGLATSSVAILYQVSLFSNLQIMLKLEPVGILTVIGAFMFGVGMVVAGGCASGVLVRMGEGLIMQWYAFFGLLLGLLLASWLYPLYADVNLGVQQLFIPDFLGLWGAWLFQILVICFLYWLFLWVEQRNGYYNLVNGPADTPKQRKNKLDLLLTPWPYRQGAIVLVILSTLVVLWNKVWGITSGLTHLFAGLTNVLLVDISQWQFFIERNREGEVFLQHPLVPLVIATVCGSFMAALLGNEFRIRKTANYRFITSALIGGLLMGIGARLANGCNVSSVMSGIPMMSVHGWTFLCFMTLGVLLGIKFLNRYLIK